MSILPITALPLLHVKASATLKTEIASVNDAGRIRRVQRGNLFPKADYHRNRPRLRFAETILHYGIFIYWLTFHNELHPTARAPPPGTPPADRSRQCEWSSPRTSDRISALAHLQFPAPPQDTQSQWARSPSRRADAHHCRPRRARRYIVPAA